MSWLPRLCKPCFAHIDHSCAGRAGPDDDWALVLCHRRLTANPVRMVAVQVVPCGRFVNILKNTPGACGFKRPEGYKPVTKAEIIKRLAALNIPVYEVDPKVLSGAIGISRCALWGQRLPSSWFAPWLRPHQSLPRSLAGVHGRCSRASCGCSAGLVVAGEWVHGPPTTLLPP